MRQKLTSPGGAGEFEDEVAALNNDSMDYSNPADTRTARR